MNGKSSAPSGQKDTTDALKRYWSLGRRKRLSVRLEFHRRRAAGLHNESCHIEVDDIIETFMSFGNACAYCGRRGILQIEHVVPLSKGGSHTLKNIICACRRCNRSKNAGDVLVWYKKQNFFCPLRWQKITRVIERSFSAKILFTKQEKEVLARQLSRPCGRHFAPGDTCQTLKCFEKQERECVSCRAKRIMNSLKELERT